MGQPHTALGDDRAINLIVGDDVPAGMIEAAHRNPPGRVSRVQRDNLKTRCLQTSRPKDSLDPNRADKPPWRRSCETLTYTNLSACCSPEPEKSLARETISTLPDIERPASRLSTDAPHVIRFARGTKILPKIFLNRPHRLEGSLWNLTPPQGAKNSFGAMPAAPPSFSGFPPRLLSRAPAI